MHPLVLASSILSASILVAAFGPRLLPEQEVSAAQACSGSVGFYSAGLEEVAKYGSEFRAFQAEVVSPQLDAGGSFQFIDFEMYGGDAVFYYQSGC